MNVLVTPTRQYLRDTDPELNDAALTQAVRSTSAEVLVVRGTKVPAATLTAGHLSPVVRAGSGYGIIDVKVTSARGVYVSNCSGKNSIAVAELTFATPRRKRSWTPCGRIQWTSLS